MKVQAAIRGFLMEWELRNRTEHASRSYRSELGVVARWLEGEGITEVEDVTVGHLREFLVYTQNRTASSINPRRPAEQDGRKLSTDSIGAYVKIIKVFFNWLYDEEVIERNP